MPTLEEMWINAAQVKAKYVDEILALPHVFAVGVGSKRTNGQFLSPDPAIVVYVLKKDANLPPEKQVKSDYDGVPTDVDKRPANLPNGCPDSSEKPFDDNTHTPLQGGVRIQAKQIRQEVGATITDYHSGTAGCFAYIGSDNVPLAQRTVVLLTCAHLMVGLCDTGTETGQTVGHPEWWHCSYCSGCCTKTFGAAILVRPELDIAAVALLEGREWVAEIHGAKKGIGDAFGNVVIKGARELVVLPLNYIVRKRGQRTGLREGFVRSIKTSVSLHKEGVCINSPITLQDVLVVENPGPQYFQCPGDSGAALINANDEVLGIMSIGDSSQTYAIGIGAIKELFEKENKPLTIATATQLHDVRKAPKPIDVVLPKSMLATARLNEVRDELTATPKGRELASLVERHADEARTLVNTNKRVATVWHRSGGPQVLHAALRAIQDTSARLPQSIGEQSFRDCIRRIAAIFTRYASKPFADDIARFEEEVARLGGSSYEELKSVLATAR